MTKRFTYVKNNSITQYQSLPIQEIGKGKALHCQGIVDKLNKLSDENEQLKDKYNEQSVEYEGLEEQIERLLDFRDNVFNLINKKLKEADKGFEQTHDEWYQGQVDALKELKKELQKK